MGCILFSRGSSRLKPDSSTLQADSLLSDSPGKPINSHKTPKSYSLFGHQTAESHCQVAPPLRRLVLCRSEASVLRFRPPPHPPPPWSPGLFLRQQHLHPPVTQAGNQGETSLHILSHHPPVVPHLSLASSPLLTQLIQSPPLGVSTPSGLSQRLQAILPTGINTDLKNLLAAAAAAAKSLQLCLILYDLIDGSPPGSPVPGILQARLLE